MVMTFSYERVEPTVFVVLWLVSVEKSNPNPPASNEVAMARWGNNVEAPRHKTANKISNVGLAKLSFDMLLLRDCKKVAFAPNIYIVNVSRNFREI